MRMWVYVVRRVLLAVPVLIGVMTVLFVFVSALPEVDRTCAFYPSSPPYPSHGYHNSPAPGPNPCTTVVPCPSNPFYECANPTYQAAVNSLGLNQPIFVQWAIYVGNSLSFQWGYINPSSPLGTGETGLGLPSLAGQSVTSVFAQFFPYSLELLLLTLVFTFLVVVPLQTRAAAHPRGASDFATRALTICGLGITLVILAPLALMGVTFALGGPAAPSLICGSQNTVFTDFYGSWPMPKCPPLYGTTNLGPFGYPSWLGWGYHSTPTGFPTIDAALHGQFWLALDTLLRMVIPALLLAFVAIAVVFRYVRYHPTDRMDFEFLRRARALGLPESKVFPRQARRYAFSATLPALTLAVIWVFMFLWVVEILFGLYGLGPLFFGAAAFFSHADYATLYGLMLLFAYLLVGTDIFAGSLRAYLDPRFRTT